MARRRDPSPSQGAMLPRRRQTKAPQSDDEIVSTESQNILAMRPLFQEPKTDEKEVEQFRAKVDADRERLKAHLDRRTRHIEEAETRRRNEIAATILHALKTPNRPVQGDVPTFTGTKIADNAAYVPVANVLTASEALLDEYERLDKMIVDMRDEEEDPVAETWQQELREAEQKLQMGARVALRNVKKVLGADDASHKHNDEHSDEEIHDEGKEKQALNYELQKSLRYAERGVKRMVKGLPEDEDYEA